MYAFGFPKIGEKREFKKALENFWKGKITEEELKEEMNRLRMYMVENYRANVDVIPSNELSYYDFVLDTAIMVGVIPERFGKYEGLSTYFEMARGSKALEMTKYFNTNYHYLVPEIENENFQLFENKPLEDYLFFKSKGIETSPRILGPFSFVYLSKKSGEWIRKPKDIERILGKLLPVYKQILIELMESGCREILVDEPAFVCDLQKDHWLVIENTYEELSIFPLTLFVYYDSISDYKSYVSLPVGRLHLDFVSNTENLRNFEKFGFPSDKELIAGVINGRQPWRANLKKVVELLDKLGASAISNSCPLFHLPITVELENNLPEGLKEKLAFAKEKLEELKMIKEFFEGESQDLPEVSFENFAVNHDVSERIKSFSPDVFKREKEYPERERIQGEKLRLPLFPTTTIGSFPQTVEVRKMRTKYKKGEISKEEYESFIKEQIRKAVELQEEIGLDVLVHGEFERSDMVEFFAEKLDGIATTQNGWVLSYGSRCYRPPIIYGTVTRPEPMSLKEVLYAQSLTEKPVKGMLTGPITIMSWSYYREDIPEKEIAYQIALAINEEVKDLEKAGIKIIQIDEPAFREKAPIKKSKWPEYFEWAINAFNLAANAKAETQIHAHMCYSDFNEIIEYIHRLEFDVISIEASRSKGEIVSAFENFRGWKKQIGVGVWDIHSPSIPSVDEMRSIIERVLMFLPKELIWINPDCGLKTRNWEEVIPSLKNMVALARELRKVYNEN
ncbi:5-methyltetrahydropteroyltriglutamate--homocysteine S-methyltransferase [Thermotoga sp. SG1]|uniref:5-methyltetrahydropteroyltriglutamate-- homocysteine S-methyltransferase n=1 Tax=Thermotoga sp. SG1 TaxID=126739 RepID=UPI001E2A6A4E|nr:5-methyltetrahydropteroyltriglutamate--homocysteine S-methyltransferase [Thermotoga sp. SG1]